MTLQARQNYKHKDVQQVLKARKTEVYSALACSNLRALNVASHLLYSILCLVLNREANENIGRIDKALSPTYFNT